MNILIVVLSFVAGAAWRRWHGIGYLNRAVRIPVAVALAVAITWPLGWHTAILYGMLATLLWVPGDTEFEDFTNMLARYGPMPCIMGWLLIPHAGWLALVYWLVGPTVALAYQVAEELPFKAKNKWIDGGNALVEMLLGGLVYGGLAALVYL